MMWKRKFTITILLSIFFLVLVHSAQGQDVRAALFREANTAMQAAIDAQADILSPKSYARGLKKYREAEKEKNIDKIRKKLAEATREFTKAKGTTDVARVTFGKHLKARSDAVNSDAPRYAAEQWQRAEKKFLEAARELESGDMKDARKKADEAEKIYRLAELQAIKVNYLAETWELLRKADDEDVKDYAPRTLRRARELIQQAEAELVNNRYDTDVARNLAQQAKYEARHAIYLANTIRKIKDADQGLEDILLATERPLKKIAVEIDFVPKFDNGFGSATTKIINFIKTYIDSTQYLSQELAERNQLISNQEARIKELEQELGGVTREKSALARRIEAQARVRAQFARVEQMFGREEAHVLREGNSILIRLKGLNFGVGKSVIEPQYFTLLSKVKAAINTFPDCQVSINGHTDSHGSDQANLRLSTERAIAVRQYLLANMEINPARIEARGFGESNPIANNETAEGRAKNRRIDIVIHPQLSGTN